ncbi:MAG: GxxExxY protein [ANME-2 cluster archaeon]|nr:GxxExxY protein [ANME-2 cluster archaeon]MBC2700719.1 GxxExxY protein [ANME-2 cluster archaeon]MBC2708930.1 GxxExxY protein [ANME-2 cluster archaeon]MBC2748139.1 GxxExxY protein [ANME-2 cluster archaeon]
MKPVTYSNYFHPRFIRMDDRRLYQGVLNYILKFFQPFKTFVFCSNQGGNYFADIIADQIILEIKSAEGLREENKAQLINYLKATDKEVGLLLNFGRNPEFKRLIFTNDRKE